MDSPLPYDEIVPDRTDSAAEDFLAALREEQHRYLATTAAAAAKLAAAGGQLSRVAAMHNGLTRQFFDAQRCVMNRRAQVDAEVRAIEASAELDAAATLTAVVVAAEQGRLEELRPLLHESHWTEPDWQSDDPSAQREITTLGRSLVRSRADVDALENVVNDALRSTGPDVAGAHNALAGVLDDWWQAEVQENRAAVDDAHARAIMVRHIAAVEASEMVEAARLAAESLDVADDGPLLPDEIMADLDAAEAGGIHNLLAALAESLEQRPAIAVARSTTPVIALPAVSAQAGSPESFRRFWESVPDIRGTRRLLGRRST